MGGKLVAYYRVSTAKQGRSGLGLEGQEACLADFAKRTGAKIVAAYTEVESGKRKDRPELAKAIAHARRSKATLAVAKLDRLARNVAFLSSLMESGCDFMACDNPHATPFTVHILAAVAEHEAKQIAERTRVALAAAKRRGMKLGSARPGHWEGREDRRRLGAKRGAKGAAVAHRQAAAEAYTDLYPIISERQAAGASLRTIAAELNAAGHTTRRGAEWNAAQVRRVALLAQAAGQ